MVSLRHASSDSPDPWNLDVDGNVVAANGVVVAKLAKHVSSRTTKLILMAPRLLRDIEDALALLENGVRLVVQELGFPAERAGEIEDPVLKQLRATLEAVQGNE